jgi:polysaccharide export outer membrane protein
MTIDPVVQSAVRPAAHGSLPHALPRGWLIGCLMLAGCVGGMLAQAPTAPGISIPSGPQSAAPGALQSQSPTSLAGQSALYPGEDFLLGPGDLITVKIFGQPEYFSTVRIGTDGSAELPYLGSVHLQGLNLRGAQRLIADLLRTGQFYLAPDVTVQVLESVNGSIAITGELKAIVPITGPRHLIDVLSAAGGLPASANHTVRIVRPGVLQPIVVNLGANLTHGEQADTLVYPRDIIQINKAGVVYVMGAFRTQGSLALDQATPLTLLQLAALSGGVGFEGRFDQLRIIRTVGTERKFVELDIKKVINGQAPDPVLESNDIVYLPTNNTKAVLKNLGIGGVLGLVSLAISLRGSF